MRATVLCYNLKGTAKGRKIGMIFGFLGYRVRHVEKEEYLLPVGEVAEGRSAEAVNEESGSGTGKSAIAGGKKEAVAAGTAATEESVESAVTNEMAGAEEVFQDEMLVMCPDNERMLDQALMRMRKEKVQIPLKAVLTETNQSWTSVELHDEIMREHEKMTGGKL